ncbi:hypothetical protein SASPL_106889 [Salvia splendens]|uniref:Uncharacterized protein n=2 Tax=Salvia splendens TaxID=180675 RepID=A0A8X8Y9F2_SALSN|nr:hypothetical protein SASPL_106889 [Salvia splendens]
MDSPNLEDPTCFPHPSGITTKSIIFILGLIWSYMMVEKTFLDILITRLVKAWKAYDLRISAIVVSSHEAATFLFVAIFSYATDVNRSRLGRFRMVVFSTTVCIAGLMLYVMTETDDKGQPNLWLFFYPALGLLGLAQAGHKVTLRVFLEDQFRRRRVETNDKERRRCTKFWWFLVSVVAAIFAQLEPLTGFPFKTLALALISVMMFFFIVFFLGFEQYHNGEIDNDEAPHQGITWRMIIILLRLWVCLSSLSLVSASGSTFFLLEATSLVAHHDNLFAILILANLVRCVEIMVSELSRWATKQLGFRISIVELMRIGMGIGCCILCCNIASIAADDRGGGVMSVYWLIPQFFLLGLVRGFAKDGFQSVFESNVHPPYKIHGRCLGALTTGFGSLLSILCVYIFGMKQFYIFGSKQFQWFQYDLENSRLNKYYNFLSILSVWNGFLYVDLMRSYVGTWFLMEDAEMQKAYLDHKQKMG